jgi:DNA-binding IclR family transcriptional regulator
LPVRYHLSIVEDPSVSAPPEINWTFLTNHGLVLLAIAQDPEARVRDIAVRVGITERSAQRIVADLLEAGYVSRSRSGRRNVYTFHGEVHLPHATTRHQEVGALMATLMEGSPTPLP